MRLFGWWRKPLFCELCGSPVVLVREGNGFDPSTGEHRTRKRWLCEQWRSGSRHYDSDGEA